VPASIHRTLSGFFFVFESTSPHTNPSHFWLHARTVERDRETWQFWQKTFLKSGNEKTKIKFKDRHFGKERKKAN
jgi:hypothetical protein